MPELETTRSEDDPKDHVRKAASKILKALVSGVARLSRAAFFSDTFVHESRIPTILLVGSL